MENLTDIINALPMPTWNHLGVNGAKNPNFPAPTNDNSILNYALATGMNQAEVTIDSKADAALEDFIAKNATVKLGLTFNETVTEPLFLTGSLDKHKNTFAESLNLAIEENANVTIYHTMESDKSNEGFYASLMKLKARKNSTTKLVLVQLFSNDVQNWSSLVIETEDGAKVDVIRVLLGSDKTYASVIANLIGNDSEYSLSTYYQLEKKQLIDVNDIASHIGLRTLSDMVFTGIMNDESSKIYRGTIDFQKGAINSKGHELDDVLLMSPKIHNKTCPLILCGEENVAGEHAATIGRFNDEHLFYLCSRGLTVEMAKQLLVDAKQNSVIGKIDDENLVNKIKEFINA